MSTYDITKPESLAELEKHLSSNLFIGGTSPNAQDAFTYELFGQNTPDAEKFPGIAGWYFNIHYFFLVRESWKVEKPKSPKKSPTKKSPAKKKAPAAKKEEDDLDDMFGDDEPKETEEEKKARQEKMKKDAENKKKAEKKKEVVIAKSLVLLEVKVFEMEQDLDKLAEKIKKIEFAGLVWKEQYKIEEIAFGMKKLVIGMVVEDEKVSVDDITDKICSYENEVQSVDIRSFDKI